MGTSLDANGLGHKVQSFHQATFWGEGDGGSFPETDRPKTLAERYAAIIGIAHGLPPNLEDEHDHYICGTLVALAQVYAERVAVLCSSAMHC